MKNIFLAEDDADDVEFFKDALKHVSVLTELTLSSNGLELMKNLEVLEIHPPPHVIFLDLNMPLKDGFQCLNEIRNTPKLKGIPIVIFSTSNSPVSVDKTYEQGANYYIRKPNTFQLLVKAIEMVLTLEMYQFPQTNKENFVLKL